MGKRDGVWRRRTEGQWTFVVGEPGLGRPSPIAPRLQQWQSEMAAQIPTSRRRVALTAAIGLIAIVLPVGSADGSAHHTKAFHPVTKTERSLIFRPRHLDGVPVDDDGDAVADLERVDIVAERRHCA